MTPRMWLTAACAVAIVGAAVLGGLHFAQRDGPNPVVDSTAGTLVDGMSTNAILEALRQQGHDVGRDSDADGLADALENFVYGSDPQRFSTTGNGIPDGWLAHHGFDPTRPGIELEPAAEPEPDDLPPDYAGHWPDRYRWTLGEAYQLGMPIDHPANATWDNGIDPRVPVGPGGIPVAWLAFHRLGLAGDLSSQVLNGESTVLESFLHDTDPRVADGDHDGLSDRDELQRYRTDPHLESTSGSGVPDGWLVHFGLDPLERELGSRDIAGKGLTVRATWEFDLKRFGRVQALAGSGLDPTRLSHRNDGVPDGWLVRFGLDPLEAGAGTRVLTCAAQDPAVRDLAQGPPGLPAIPDLCITVADVYAQGRPASWDEAKDGLWLGGLDPTLGDNDADGLADVLELRGWYLQRFLDVGPATTPSWSHVASDPQRADTDQDGLRDAEEYAGVAVRGSVTTRFSASDPGNADTAFSGIPDAEKVFANVSGLQLDLFAPLAGGARRALLDPARVDSAGSYLGDERYLAYWTKASQAAAACARYRDLHPGSLHERYGDWINRLEWVQDAQRTLDCVAQGQALAPDGDIDGDGRRNLVDPDPATPDGVVVPAGWKLDPALLRFSEFPTLASRAPIDPANPDTDGDHLPDAWELRHGQFVAGRAGSDIDPARWNSDPLQPLSDADQNLNGDIVAWSAYYPQSGRLERHGCDYSFTNLEKFLAGADPHRLDEKGFGVTAGWTHFWGKVYPSLVQLTPAQPQPDGVAAEACRKDAGARLPDLASAPNVALRSALNDGKTDLGAYEVARLEYRRFEREQGGQRFSPPTPNPNGESLHARSAPIRLPDGRTVVIDTIQGTFSATLPVEAAAGLNPYDADSDGDLMPDVWEVHAAKGCIAGALDPSGPDGGLDPDADGLTNVQEHQLAFAFIYSTDPCQRDTRGDGMDDKTVAALGNPVVPGSAIDAADGNGHSDGDGEDDRNELLQGTDPRRADTAFSGLLDYADLCLDLERLDASNQVVPDLRTLDLLQHGVAHHWLGDECPVGFASIHGSQHILFLGSEGQPRDARQQVVNAANAPVPDGWIVAQQGRPDLPLTLSQKASYACGRPVSWDEARLGPWWWGLPIQSQEPCTRDLDQDGLDDRNGEDPVPAASQSNTPPTAPGLLQAALAGPASDPVQLLKLAQGSGECAGDTAPCRQAWAAAASGLTAVRVPTTLVDLSATLANGGELPAGVLPKETPFTVSGRLVAHCGDAPCEAAGAPVGLAKRTVVVRMAAPVGNAAPDDVTRRAYNVGDGSVLGVGFTDADGWFTVPACLCKAAGGTTLPAGVTALGAAPRAGAESVGWQPDAAKVPVGALRFLAVHAYATPAAIGGTVPATGPTPLLELPASHPQRLALGQGCGAVTCRASLATSAVLAGVRTISTPSTQLEMAVARSVAWDPEGRSLTVSALLTDASGAPLAGRTVALAFQPALPGADRSGLVTDSAGQVQREFDVPSEGKAIVGQLTTRLWFNGTATIPAASLQPLAHAVLQAPLTLSMSADGPAYVSKPFGVTARALSQGQPVPGLVVTGALGNLPLEGTTDAEGWARLGTVLNGAQPGQQTLTLQTAASTAYQAAQATLPVKVLTGSRLAANMPATVEAGVPFRVTGRLVTDADNAVPDARIQVLLDGEPVGLLRTDNQGRIDDQVALPASLHVGTHALRLRFDGIAGVEGTHADASVFVQVASRLSMTVSQASPNGTATVTGQLTSVDGRGLPGQVVHVTGGPSARVTVTSDQGAFHASLPVPAEAPLGPWPVTATYEGSRNATYGAAMATGIALLGSASRIDLGPAPRLLRGNNTWVGHLVQQANGAGIPDAEVQVEAAGIPAATVISDSEGRIEVPLPIDERRIGGPVAINLTYAGDGLHGPAVANATLPFRAPSRLALSSPPEAGRGTTVEVTLRLLDDAGNPVAGDLLATFLGATMTLRTGPGGEGRLPMPIPDDAPDGPTTLTVVYAGDGAHLPVEARRELAVKEGAFLTVQLPEGRLDPGEAVPIRLRLLDEAGRPLADQPVALRVDGQAAAILARTDSDGWAVAAVNAPAQGALRLSAVFAGSPELASTKAVADLVVTVTGPAAGIPWLAVAAIVLVLAASAGLAVLAIRRRAMRPLEEALRRTEARIRAGDPWAGAVLLAYRALADHLRRAGMPERPDQSVRDFVRDVVSATKVPEAVAVAFVQAVERARYAGGAMDPADAAQARGALQAMLRSVRRAGA